MQQPTTDSTLRRLVLVVGGEFPGHHDPEARRLVSATAGAHVLLVAPAGRVPGERWVVDLTAREEQAHRRLASWTQALGPHAERIEGEVGDPCVALAVEDAHRAFAPHDVLVHAPAATAAPAAPRRSRSPRPRSGALIRSLRLAELRI